MNIQKIEHQIENFRKENEVPGISISIVKNNKIVYQNGFGYRDVLNKLPVTPKTIWPIASITKSFTSISAPVKQPNFSAESHKSASQIL